MKFPWSNYIQKKKDQIMIEMKGKKVFGLSAEDWVLFDKKFKEKFPFASKLDDITDNVRHKFSNWWEKLKAPKYYISNVRYGTHILKTTLKKGQWYEPQDRMEDALFLLMKNFIEKDDKHGYDYYLEQKAKGTVEKHPRNDLYDMCEEAVKFWYHDKPALEKKTDDLYASIPAVPEDDVSPMAMLANGLYPERDKIRDEVFALSRDIEEEITNKTTYYLLKLMMYRGHLWS
jgi:hypothetical protein